MKKIIMIAATCMLALSSYAGPLKFGVTAGVNSMGFSLSDQPNKEDIKNNLENATSYQGGISLQLNLPLGFSIQPSALYMQKTGSTYDATNLLNTTVKSGYLEVPVALQWGPDLLLFRPYVEAVPFVGYALHNEICVKENIANTVLGKQPNQWEGVNRFEYGASLGAGLEIWKLQINYRYNWSLGSLTKLEDLTNIDSEQIKNQLKGLDKNNVSGHTISLTLFF